VIEVLILFYGVSCANILIQNTDAYKPTTHIPWAIGEMEAKGVEQ